MREWCDGFGVWCWVSFLNPIYDDATLMLLLRHDLFWHWDDITSQEGRKEPERTPVMSVRALDEAERLCYSDA